MDNVTEKSVIVALLPQDDSWCKVEPAHLTLVYAGETDSLKSSVFNELAKDAASIGMLSNMVMAKVSGLAVFGENSDRVDVFRISSTPELLAMRKMLENWDVSEFEFNPHVTIGPEGSWNNNDWNSNSMPMPMYLVFDRISVFWGQDRLNFWLRKY